RQEALLLGWLKALPDELVRARPMLSIHYTGALLSVGAVDDAERRLRDVEWWLAATADGTEKTEAPPEMPEVIGANPDDLHRLPADDHLGRGGAAGLLGLATWATGDLEAAQQGYREAMTLLQKAEHLSDVIGCAYTLADIQIAQGNLRAAMRTYEEALRLG